MFFKILFLVVFISVGAIFGEHIFSVVFRDVNISDLLPKNINFTAGAINPFIK